MSAGSRDRRPVLRRAAALLSGCAFAALLVAATPGPELLELDEQQVVGKVRWPLEDYLEFPRYDSVVISPGGTHLATGWGEDSFQRRLSIVDFPSMAPRINGLLQIYFGVSDLRWLDENRMLVQPDWPLLGFRRLREPIGTMLVTDVAGAALHQLSPFPAGTIDAFDRQRALKVLVEQIEKVSLADEDKDKDKVPRKGPNAFGPAKAVVTRGGRADQLLFQTLWNGDDSSSDGYGVFRLDLASCEQVRVALLPLPGGQVIAGPENRPALVAGVNEAGERVVYFLPEEARSEGRDWQLRVRSRSGERGLVPVTWTGEGEEYYALDGRTTQTRAVVVWNARDNTQRLLYRHRDADMDVAWLDPAGKPWMFSGISHFPVYWYPDPAHPLAQLHSALAQHLPREHVDIMNATDDLSTAVVRVSSGNRPTMFLVVDVKAVKSLTGMHTYPKLKGRRLAPVEAIEFPARDGLAIRGYLTTPLNDAGKPQRGLPLVVIAHDGPREEFADYRYVADSRYEFERQLFASRGYAVLQVNARGTGGRGAMFERAGDGKWGREVQDDFADAVRWAIKDGVAAAGHVCFYGTGYGAYSALMAAARQPDLFQCVIGLGGVYDLPLLVEDASRQEGTIRPESLMDQLGRGGICRGLEQEIFAGMRTPPAAVREKVLDALKEGRSKEPAPMEIPRFLQRAIGNDLQELKARSPVTHASSIKAKVLLMHQHLDPQASREQMSAMQGALRAARNPARTQTIGEEFGGYFTPATRAPVYKEMLEFLDKQIGN